MRERTVGSAGAAVLALLVAVVALLPGSPVSAERPGRPFDGVVETVVHGDVVVAGNSNLLSAGGWAPEQATAADVDRDVSPLCVTRGAAGWACSDNSSSARLDVPRGARVVAARLYVTTALSERAGPLAVRLDGPGRGFDYRLADQRTRGVRKVWEESVPLSVSGVARQVVWDVTRFVRTGGGGWYTVADIVNERAGAYLPFAAWAIVAVYELDPGTDLSSLPAGQQERFARRAITWHDGLVLTRESGRTRIARMAGLPVDATFAKSMHLVAGARWGEPDNLLVNGRPVGNNLTPGDRPAPAGSAPGRDRRCNSTTDVFNETICELGAAVASKQPGPRRYLAAVDGRSRSSSSAVDLDVVRIPDRYLTVGRRSTWVSVITAGQPVVVGMLALSSDLPTEAPQ